jgi:hypothetical protein
MKARSQFVSNSSTSSYVCDFCGEQFTGWDGGFREFDLAECENGHTMCQEHFVNGFQEWKDKVDDEESDEWIEDWRYCVPEKFCPFCSLIHLDNGLVLKYVAKLGGIDLDLIEEEIRFKFTTRAELKEFLKND